MVIMYIFTIFLQYIYVGALVIILLSESNVCEIVLQESVYDHYFLEYTWVTYVLAFPGKNLFICQAAHCEFLWQYFVHITDVYFLSLPVGSETFSCLVPINHMTLKFGMYFASCSGHHTFV